MKFLEVSSAMKVNSRHGHKVYVVSHDLRQFVTIVLRPSIAERLRQPSNGFFIRVDLRAQARTCQHEHQDERAYQISHSPVPTKSVIKVTEKEQRASRGESFGRSATQSATRCTAAVHMMP